MQTFIGLTLLGAFIALVVGVTLFLATPATKATGKRTIFAALLAFAVGLGGLLVLPGDNEADPDLLSRFDKQPGNSPSSSPEAQKPAPQNETVLVLNTSSMADDSCRQDLDCWGGRNTVQAAFHCNSAVEQQTADPFRWTHSFGSPKFDSYRWHNEEAGQVIYQGSRLEVQGNNGTWSPLQYECTFDPKTNQVLTIHTSATQS